MAIPQKFDDDKTIKKKKILIGHLNANGDILYSSAIARQIKEVDYPCCHITWAVSQRCARTLDLNPYIDELWEIPLASTADVTEVWNQFLQEAGHRMEAGEFDIFIPLQLIGDQLLHFNKTLRLSTLGLYGKSIFVSLEPVVKLSETEIENVRQFCGIHKIRDYKRVILIECAPMSGQSSVTPQFALELVYELNKMVRDTCFILSSYISIKGNASNIINASELSFRENAELSKYCDLLIGCSSGITWLLTSNWAKPLPMVQLLNKNSVWFNSVVKDYEVRGVTANQVLEMYTFSTLSVANCIFLILNDSFKNARDNFHQQYNSFWCSTESSILFNLLKRGRVMISFKFVRNTYINNNKNVLFIASLFKELLKKCIIGLLNKMRP